MSEGKRTVLIADDSSIARRQLAEILESSGEYAVVGHAANGAQAVSLFARLAPALTCLDMVMPIMDGAQALRAIRARDADAKVVIVTSLGTVATLAIEATDWGAAAVLVKPLVDDEVLAVLREI